MKKLLPQLSILAAGILWGCISLFINPLCDMGFSVVQISVIRQFISALLFGILILITDPSRFRIRLKDIWIFICSGVVSVSLFGACYFYTIEQSQASVAVVLLYTSPIFVMIISAIAFKEKVTVQKLAALVLTFAGCVFCSGLIGNSYTVRASVLLTGLASGLFYALYTIFCNFGLRKYSSLTVTFWTFVFGFFGSLPFGRPESIIPVIAAQPRALIFCAGVGIINTFLPYLCYTWGLKYVEGSKAAIIVAAEVLVAAVIGMTVYSEPHNVIKIIGIFLIFISVVLLNINIRGRKNS